MNNHGQNFAASLIDTDAFPSLIGLPLTNAAVDEVRANVKAPKPLIFSAALTALSVGLQGLFDVQKPSGGIAPCSLMILTIANSGERKSTVENIFLAGVRRYQKQMADRYEKDYLAWKIKFKIWGVKDKAIQKAIATRTSKGLATTDEEQLLYEHSKAVPEKPKKFKMLYDDTTSQALFRGLYQDFPSAGLISGEGSGVLNGPALNDLPKQNALWSGDSITVDRATVESFQLDDARLTVSIMVQESAFKNYIQTRGEASRGSGLWARFLVCQPKSTQGNRQVEGVTTNTEHSERFTERLCEYVERNVELLGIEKPRRKVIEFSHEAVQRWVILTNEIESQINPAGRMRAASDHASKLADNIARLAALFHCFERFCGDVSLQTLNIAISIGLWYSNEFLKLFDSESRAEDDINCLVDWLCSKYIPNYPYIKKNIVLQYGPSRLREKKRLDDALNALADRGAIKKCFGPRGESLIGLNCGGGLSIFLYSKRGRMNELGF